MCIPGVMPLSHPVQLYPGSTPHFRALNPPRGRHLATAVQYGSVIPERAVPVIVISNRMAQLQSSLLAGDLNEVNEEVIHERR